MASYNAHSTAIHAPIANHWLGLRSEKISVVSVDPSSPKNWKFRNINIPQGHIAQGLQNWFTAKWPLFL